jgi:hypothetical protein
LRACFPEGQSNIIEDKRGAENDKRPLTLLEVDMLINSSLGGISHRFARMFNCDQAVPDFTMNNILRYPDANMDETLGVLSRHLLAHWLPHGHTFEMRPQETALNCSSGYMTWSAHSLGFLLEASSFIGGVAAPLAAAKGKSAAFVGAYSSVLLLFFYYISN